MGCRFSRYAINPLSAKFIKWSNTLKQIVGKLPTICLSVFDHFSGLALKGLISKFNQEFRFFLCVIDIYSKYAWVVPLKDKKGVSIVNAFQIILKKSDIKPNKIWVDKGSEFYNRSMKSWLEKNDIEMYSAHNEGKSVVADRFIRTIKYKIYKHMTSISKNV